MTDASAIETIADVRAALAGGGSAVDVCTIFLERIQERDAALGAFTHVASDTALEEAATVRLSASTGVACHTTLCCVRGSTACNASRSKAMAIQVLYQAMAMQVPLLLV